VNPGAHDLCDASNNVIPKDCNASNNDELNCGSFCGDTDADGFVPTSVYNNYNIIQIIVCYAKQPGDCNDNDATINPLAIEICDGIDNNCNGKIDEGCASVDKTDILTALNSMTTSDKKSADEIQKAIKEITESLGNRIVGGDKKIVWIDSAHISCRHGFKVFDHEKKAVGHLEHVTDPALQTQVQSAINSLVNADRKLAQTAINEASAGKEKTKALENFAKGEAATDAKKKIQYYRKAWKHVNHNKNCEKVAKVSCIDEITATSPMGDSVTAIGDEVGHPETVFTDIYDNQVVVHTSCSRCLYIGQVINGWTITELVDDGSLALKCAGAKK
jgi:hypothetical protein